MIFHETKLKGAFIIELERLEEELQLIELDVKGTAESIDLEELARKDTKFGPIKIIQMPVKKSELEKKER